MAGVIVALSGHLAHASSAWPHEPPGSTVILDWPTDTFAGSGLVGESSTCQIISDPTGLLAPFQSQNALQASWPVGMLYGGCSLDSDGILSPQPLKDFYFGFWFKMDYPGADNGYDKIIYFQGDDYMNDPYWFNDQAVMLEGCPTCDLVLVNDMQDASLNNCHISGTTGDSYCSQLHPNAGSGIVARNQWHQIEVFMRVGASKTSQDGWFLEWLDGQPVMDYRNVNNGPQLINNIQFTQTLTIPDLQHDQTYHTFTWSQYLHGMHISRANGVFPPPLSQADSMPPGAPRGLTVL